MLLRLWVMRRRIALVLACLLIDYWPAGVDEIADAAMRIASGAAIFVGAMVLFPTTRVAVTPLLAGFALAALIDRSFDLGALTGLENGAGYLKMALGFGLMALVVQGRSLLNRIRIARMVLRPAQIVVALPREDVWNRIEYRPRTDTLDDFVERFEEAPGRPGAIRVVYRPVDPKIGNWIDAELRDVEPGRRFSICALPDPNAMAGDMISAMTITLEDCAAGTRLAAVEVVSNIGLADAINPWLDDILADHLAHWRAKLVGGKDWSLKHAMLKTIKPPKQAQA